MSAPAAASVEQAYAEVERVTRREAKNFAYGIMLLPRPKRRAIAAIYAFARRVDDLADGPLPLVEKRRRLEALRASLADETPGEPMLVALADARRRYQISEAPFAALVAGGLQDTEQTRYASADDLLGYCEKVAGAVGLACLPVYRDGECRDDEAARARTLGVALQLINIVRDVAEDWRLGRVYLPQDELAAFGVSEDDLAAGRVTPQWRALMAFHSARARARLAEGLGLLESLDRRSRLCVAVFAGLYQATLDRIETDGFRVFDGQTRLSPPRKLAVVARGLLG